MSIVPFTASDGRYCRLNGPTATSSAEEVAVGPFSLQYRPSEAVNGTIDMTLLRRIYGSHGEGTPYETTSLNTAADGTPMRSIGTYRQN